MIKKLLYILGLVIFVFFASIIFRNANLMSFIDSIENRTFDLRQSIMINRGVKKPSKDIVIVAIDDATYEYILDNYGEWPVTRDVYADMVEFLERQSPRAIVFDLMFVKSLKSHSRADEALIKVFEKYDNLYTSMNLDNQSKDIRKPPELPDKFSLKIYNNSRVDFSGLTFSNCRTILDGILKATPNVGMININRPDDGILRTMPLVVKYKGSYYPQLALKVGLNILGEPDRNFEIDKYSNFRLGDKRIYLEKDGNVILNWYGPAGSYDYVPMYQLIKATKGIHTNLDYNFSNKIVYFGSTASSLYDIKTVPTSKSYPGVEVQATYINNLLDNSFIIRINKGYTIALSLLIAFLIWSVISRVNSILIASLMSFSTYFIYLIIAYYAMKYENLWLEVVYPFIFSIFAFTCAYITKYLIKSRDFEQQYKLATTDGLTELFNHRYFQEQMKLQVEHAKRYDANFSLIIIDIDFFKKFNDNFGHQSGDAVLKQVAQTLKKNVRSADIVCRYGGEEMSIILPNTDKDVAIYTAEKICERVANKKFVLSGDKETNVTISLGVATFPTDGSSASEIIEVADKRLYEAKNNGRNQVR